MSNDSRQLGVTLVELMVAMAIASVMLVFALPAFNDFIGQRRVVSNVNFVISAINYTRNEAARRGLNVSLQAVDGAAAGNEWGPGFCVVEGNPGNCDNPITEFFPEINVTVNGIGAFNTLETLTFNSRGMFTGLVAGQIDVCGLDATDDPGRQVRMTAVGRASVVQLVCFP